MNAIMHDDLGSCDLCDDQATRIMCSEACNWCDNPACKTTGWCAQWFIGHFCDACFELQEAEMRRYTYLAWMRMLGPATEDYSI